MTQTKLDFDERFQEGIVRLLFQDPAFAEAALEYLKPTVFENPIHSWTVRTMRQCLANNGALPDAMVLKQERRKAERMGVIRKEDAEAYRAFLAKKLHRPVTNRTYIKRELQQFVKHQALKDFILDAAERLLPQHKYEEVDKAMARALDLDLTGDYSIGVRPGDTYRDRIESREHLSSEPGITTGIAELDRLMVRGGCAPKQLGTVIAPTGRGKCLGKGTLVLMHDGTLRKVEEVRVGDLLMGPDSKPREVLSTTSGRSPLFRIEPVKGDPWVCNDVHVLTLVHTETGAVVDVPLDEYLKWSKTQKRLHKQFSVGVRWRPSDNELPVDPYFLGVWFGDGSKRTDVVRVTTTDEAVRHACEREATRWGLTLSEYPDERTRDTSTYGLVGAQGRSNGLGRVLRSLVGSDFTVPRAYLTATPTERLEFLAGWLDTDGSLHYGGFDFTQKRKDYVDAVAFLARSLGFKVVNQKTKVVNGVGYFRIGISGNCSVIPTRIPHKRASFRRQVKDACRTGFKVQPIGSGTYYGFTLDGDGRFLLGDFTVTHNTNFLINLACSAVLDGVPTLYVTLELDEETILTRMDARFTGVSLKNLKSDKHEVEAAWKKIHQHVSKNLVVKEFPPGATTVAMLKQHIRKLEREGFYPKLIVIDYADLLKPRIEFADSSYETQGQVYIDILGMLAELKMVGWTATQGNRKSMDKDTAGDVDLSMMADSVKKAFLAYVVLGIAQSAKEKKMKKGRVVLLKNRNGPSDRELKVAIEHDIATFRSLT